MKMELGTWEGPARSVGHCRFHDGVCVYCCAFVHRVARVVAVVCVCASRVLLFEAVVCLASGDSAL